MTPVVNRLSIVVVRWLKKEKLTGDVRGWALRGLATNLVKSSVFLVVFVGGYVYFLKNL